MMDDDGSKDQLVFPVERIGRRHPLLKEGLSSPRRSSINLPFLASSMMTSINTTLFSHSFNSHNS